MMKTAQLIGSVLTRIGMALARKGNKAGESQYVSQVGNQRIIRLEDGDAALILKKSGQSLTIGSGSKEAQENDELVFMLMLYLSNPDFVRLLYQLYQENLDKARAEQFKEGVSPVRGSRYDGKNA